MSIICNTVIESSQWLDIMYYISVTTFCTSHSPFKKTETLSFSEFSIMKFMRVVMGSMPIFSAMWNEERPRQVTSLHYRWPQHTTSSPSGRHQASPLSWICSCCCCCSPVPLFLYNNTQGPCPPTLTLTMKNPKYPVIFGLKLIDTYFKTWI